MGRQRERGGRLREDPEPPLRLGQQTTVSWDHTVSAAGDYWVQLGVWRQKPYIANNLLDKEPSPSQKLIVGQAAAKFQVIDRVHTTANLNVRTGPGTSYPEVSGPAYPGYAPAGSAGTVVGGPVPADAYTW